MVPAKPIVAILPKVEREALRNCGALPIGFFQIFGDDSVPSSAARDSAVPSIYLWEHEIDYGRGEELAARVEDRPADIPVFFGMEDSADDEQRQANEVAITRLLDSVVVHIVFLDNRENAGRGYAEFRSFAEIAAWSRHFNKVLGIRFPNENALRNTENVLVIVARGEQVKVSREELDVFNGCVGELKAFKSCYFLDYNLSVDESRELFHARAVWDVMVGRLLLAFLLAQESDGASGRVKVEKFWLRSGIKVWRAAECAMDVPAEFIEREIGSALAAAYARVQALVDHERHALLTFETADPLPELAIENLVPSTAVERDMPSGGWSEFPAEACAREVGDPSRWHDAFRAVREVAGEWKSRQPLTVLAGGAEVKKSFESAHEEPGRIFPLSKQLFGALDQDRTAAKECGVDTLDLRWQQVVEVERKRQSMIKQAQREAHELRRAQNHYVGIGFGLVVVVAVSALCGWVLSQLIVCLYSNIRFSIWLACAAALGSFGIFCLVLYLHWRAGRKGVEALIETCLSADKHMQIRHDRVKAIVEAALCTRARLRRLNTRFRAWTLLERVKSIVITELQPATALVCHVEPMESERVLPDSSAGRRRAFLSLTRKSIQVHSTGISGGGYQEEVEHWWGEKSKNARDNFRALWSRLCRIDKNSAGHFPSREFVPRIREFVSRFTARIHGLAVAGVILENQAEVRAQILKWLNEDVLYSSVRQFVSGSIDARHDDESRQLPGIIFVQDKTKELGVDALRSAANSDVALHKYEIVPSDCIEFSGQLAFLYQEFRVEFDRNADTGHLIFKGVRDA